MNFVVIALAGSHKVHDAFHLSFIGFTPQIVSDEELKGLWKSDELSTKLIIVVEEIVYVCPENHAQATHDLERIQRKRARK